MRINPVPYNLILTLMIVYGVDFTFVMIHFNEHPMQIFSVAHAEIQTYTTSDTAMFDFGEDDSEIVETVKNVAKIRAIQAAKEKAGIYLKSVSKTVNGILTADDISVYTSNNIEVISVTYKKLPYEAYEVKGNATGKIGIMYEAIVTTHIDPSGLSEYVELDSKEKLMLIEKNKNSQTTITETLQGFENLRNRPANTVRDQNNVKSELKKLDNILLALQILDAGDYLLSKNNYTGALDKYNEAIKLEPNFAIFYVSRGDFYKKLTRYNEAIADYTRAIKTDSSNFTEKNNVFRSVAYVLRGTLYFELKKYDEAIADCTKAIELNPELYQVYTLRGGSYMSIGDYSKAIEDFDKVLQFEESYDYYFFRGTCHLKLKNYSNAISDMTKAIEFNPRAGHCYLARGICYFALNNKEKYIEDIAMAKALGLKF